MKDLSSRTHLSLSQRDRWDLLMVFIAIYSRYLNFKNTSIARAIQVFLKSNYRKYLSPKISPIIMSYYLVDAIMELAKASQIVQTLQNRLQKEQQKRQEFYDLAHEDMKAEFINGEIIMPSPVRKAAILTLKAGGLPFVQQFPIAGQISWVFFLNLSSNGKLLDKANVEVRIAVRKEHNEATG